LLLPVGSRLAAGKVSGRHRIVVIAAVVTAGKITVIVR
jgi:hypothetical protein